MTEVIGVRFKPCGKIYNFEINGIDVNPGKWVVVESEMGLGLGLVVRGRHCVEESDKQFKKVLRVATEEDIEQDRNNRPLEEESKLFCIEKVKERGLPMKVIGTEATLDRKRIIFYFTAEGRIDFRELVRDLAAKFKTRIEMRQIGVRDEVKFLGGIGICGRQVCCALFLTSFEPVSIRMAKKQELVLNPSKLSGVCGRLMCCLGYEYEEPSLERTTPKEDIPQKIETCIEPVEISEEEKTTETVEILSQMAISCREDIKAEPRSEQESEKGKPFSMRRRFGKKRRR
ncbi:MAG TPA: hypothetical protein DEP99_02595 [Nitrospiraceae bacterium]|nr:hypothetical protein [Nitrospiraceae bacterium]